MSRRRSILLVVHHADVDTEHARAAGFDPADYVSPADVARLLDADWHVPVDKRRPRHVTSGAGAHHTADLALRALDGCAEVQRPFTKRSTQTRRCWR